MVDVFLLLAARTAVGKYLGSLAEVPAPQLGAGAITEALRRTGATPEVPESHIIGCLPQTEQQGRRVGLNVS
jgi:acetyl-CoA C-acetyltransferase